MLVKEGVLGREDGLDEPRRDPVQRKRGPVLDEEPCDHLVVAVVEDRGHAALGVGDVDHRGQVRRYLDDVPGDAGARQADQQENEKKKEQEQRAQDRASPFFLFSRLRAGRDGIPWCTAVGISGCIFYQANREEAQSELVDELSQTWL